MTERMACGHLKADWFEPSETAKELGEMRGWDERFTKAHCRTCAAIASAEARARHDAVNMCVAAVMLAHSRNVSNENWATRAINCIRAAEAAARTPDCTPKITVTHGGLPGTVSPSASGVIEKINVRNGYADAPPDSTKEHE